MASVHPSRMAFVPKQDAPPPPLPPRVSREEDLRRELKERRGSGERDRERDSDRERSERRRDDRRSSRDRSRERDKPGDRSREGDRERRERRDRDDHHARDERRRSPDRERRSTRPSPPPRRASPSYALAPPGAAPFVPPPGHAMPPFPGHAMPPPFSSRGGSVQYGQGGWHGAGGSGQLNFDRRRQQRDSMALSIWPPSPKEPYRDEEEIAADRKAAKAAAKAARRARKEARKASKHSRSKRRYSESISSSSDDERDREKRSRRKSSKRARTEERDEDDAWVVKEAEVKVPPSVALIIPPPPKAGGEDDESDEEIGPALPKDIQERNSRYGGKAFANMLPGEAAAMAAYAASGERIPRRGEIGLESDDIEKFESSGYVMSGSRHRRMNAVRLRKENQVLSAEEKRGLMKLQREEKTKKEALIIGSFKELLDDSLTTVETAE